MSDSSLSLLVLHATRLLGFASAREIAARYAIELDAATEELLDAEARGWVAHAAFAGLSGWSLTEPGKRENERLLADQLARTARSDEVRDVYERFLPPNARLLQACTHWQLRPGEGGRLVSNDHADTGWDAVVLDEITALGRELAPIAQRLAAILPRFGGYDSRFDAALRRARSGEAEWVDGTSVDSCHRVWYQLHEDLIATLGLERGSGA